MPQDARDVFASVYQVFPAWVGGILKKWTILQKFGRGFGPGQKNNGFLGPINNGRNILHVRVDTLNLIFLVSMPHFAGMCSVLHDDAIFTRWQHRTYVLP